MPGATTYNAAYAGAAVGIQAEAVHNSTVYQVLPDDPPERKYDVGIRYLENGVPTRARELIGDALARDFDGGEVRFHWVLAILSKRSYRDLDAHDRERIQSIPELITRFGGDEWTDALAAIYGLLDALNAPGDDPRLAMETLHALPKLQREAIIRHLDLVLSGGMKDGVWSDTRQVAEEQRLANDRRNRVWAYFEPEPAEARAKWVANDATSLGDRITGAVAISVFAVAAGYLGWTVTSQARAIPIFILIIVTAAGFVAARDGLEWSYRRKRNWEKEREYSGRGGGQKSAESGFANQVDHAFAHYFAKYVPHGIKREDWIIETDGVRRMLRNEVVTIYRESRIGVDRIKWLIRHVVKDARKRWREGTLWEHRERYRVGFLIKARLVTAVMLLAPSIPTVLVVAVPVTPFYGGLAAFAVMVSAWIAVEKWRMILSEKWRIAEDEEEYEHVLAERRSAYRSWKEKLDSTRPSEQEMESWLNCDKTLILDESLRHYHLAWHDILAHAFLLTPAANYKRARDQAGPWRYSKYSVRLFLITREGAREVGKELDFQGAEAISTERTNFRFEAVSSVNVTEIAEFNYVLSVTLTNGPARDYKITDPEVRRPDTVETTEMVAKMNIDAAGFTHTLHILEGIAAEGKSWFERDRMQDG